ncbi:hypothetical protein E2I00_005121, partial [Balaenoptera physalus]
SWAEGPEGEIHLYRHSHNIHLTQLLVKFNTNTKGAQKIKKECRVMIKTNLVNLRMSPSNVIPGVNKVPTGKVPSTTKVSPVSPMSRTVPSTMPMPSSLPSEAMFQALSS